VKSTFDSWKFESPDSVQWLIEHPLPVLLCVVLKREARLLVYHTAPRFYAWSLLPSLARLELVPGRGPDGMATQWKDGSTFDLSAPILDFTIQDLLDDGFVERAKKVLRFWIEGVDMENLRRMRAGVLNFKLPARYKTGESAELGSWIIQGVNKADSAAVDRAASLLREPLDWVSDQLCKLGDLPSGTRGMLLLQQLYWDDYHVPLCLSNHAGYVTELFGKDPAEGSRAGVEEIGTAMDARLIVALSDLSRLARVRRLCLSSKVVTDSLVARLASATRLQYLNLLGARITDRGIASLRNLVHLRDLFLGRTAITDKGLSSLRRLDKLRILGLGATRVTDAGLKHLKGLNALENLYLDHTRVSGAGLVQLKGLPRLEVIGLTRARVTDETLLRLRVLPQLKKLYVDGTKVTAAGVEALRQTRPDLAIMR